MSIMTRAQYTDQLGQILYKLRTDFKMNAKEMGEKVFLPPTQVTAYERGKTPVSLNVLIKYARAFQLPLSHFVLEAENAISTSNVSFNLNFARRGVKFYELKKPEIMYQLLAEVDDNLICGYYAKKKLQSCVINVNDAISNYLLV